MKGEFTAVSSIRSLLFDHALPGETWIGDDAAVLALPEGPDWLLLAADTVVAGVHADLELTGLDDFGWKAMSACISDIAAMGGRPGHAVVAVTGPPDVSIEKLYEGIAAASLSTGCPVVGGDLTNGPSLVVTVAVTGFCDGPPVPRGGAKPDDVVWVTGAVGGSAAGLRLLRAGTPIGPEATDAVRRHARPVAALAEGRAARWAGATAMIDVSDGLAADLDHIASDSAVGLRLDAVPVHPAATQEEALGGGEDFVLAFCAPPLARIEEAFSGLPAPIRIGVCTSDRRERTLGGKNLPVTGWQHRWDDN